MSSSSSSSLRDNDDNNVLQVVASGESTPTDGGGGDEPAKIGQNAAGRHERIAQYEDAIARAQRHLESFEALRRSRLDVVLAATRGGMAEADVSSSGGGPRDVLGRITSLIGGIFSSTGGGGGPNDDPFDRSWKEAEGKSSTVSAGGRGGLADFHDAVISQGNGEDIRIITLLYEHVLLANHSTYRLGGNAKKRSTDRSNRLLNRWISSYFSSLSSSSSSSGSADDTTVSARTTKRDAARVDPTLEDDGSSCAKRIFHAVIRQNVDLHSVDGIKAAEEWLGRMRHLGSGIPFCSPDADAYNIVLLGYCHLCKSFQHDRSSSKLPVRDGPDVRRAEMLTRRFVVDGVVRVLSELVENANEEEENSGPNLMSMNLALNAIAKAGGSFPNDSICQTTNKLVFDLIGEEQYRNLMNKDDESDSEKTDKLIFDLIGEEKYRKLVDPNVAPIQSDETESRVAPRIMRAGTSKKLSPNLDTYHFLVDIYSNGASIVYTKRAMAILNKMIRIRSEQDSEYLAGDVKLRNTPAAFAPSTGTHNKVLHALVEKMEENSEAVQDREKTASEAMRLLDSMVLHGSSLPSPITFLFLLRLWQNTQSVEAGEYAEEILSRMEIFCLYQNEFRVLSNAYLQALECWLTAAKVGRPGAAERAFR
jgi:hypothetical protein